MQRDNGIRDLSGRWKLRGSDGQRGAVKTHHLSETDEAKWMDAAVPGEVHLELIKRGLIGEPTEGLNALGGRWVEENRWSYRTTFEADEAALGGNAWLKFDGLDYAAKIYLNGESVGEHANFFRPCVVEVTGKLRKANLLVVVLESGLYTAGGKAVDGYYENSADHALHKRIWLRKPQCSFGWDWSTRYVNVGIHKPVLLEWGEAARLDEAVVLTRLNDRLNEGAVTVRAFVEICDEPAASVEQTGEAASVERTGQTGPAASAERTGQADRTGSAELTVAVRLGTEEVSRTTRKFAGLAAGLRRLEAELAVPSPRLWWPAGHGEQPLYEVTAEVRIGGRLVGRRVKRVGFRNVKVVQDPHPDGGRYFYLEVNGRPVFAKGANFIPADMIFMRADRDRYAGLIDRAREANFNFLRVWGGGVYESDDFYELCDERGVMVWQDFVFACGAYPTIDAGFMDNVRAEAVHNVRRLAHHPSLVMYCGNNENEWHTFDWNEGVIYPDYALYHHVLPRIVQEEDPGKYYQPSSPYSPDHEYPNADHVGDQHPWSVGFENTDFREYRRLTCRFPNEGGILGSTSLPATNASLTEDGRYVLSYAWQEHDNAVDSWFADSAPDRQIREWTGLDPREMSVEQFVYWAGLIQGEGLREYIDNFRRRKFDCAAAIFWMFNDCWPATRSWTIVDYYLNRTPSFWPVKRAFQPVSVALAHEDGKVRVIGINETDTAWRGELRYGLLRLAGGANPADERAEVALPPNASTLIAEFADDRWRSEGVRRTAAFAMLSRRGQLIARNRLLLPRFAEMEWTAPQIEIARDGDEAVFRSAAFAWGVCLDLDGAEALPDNFFDVWPGFDYRLPWPRDRELPDVRFVGNLVKR